VEIVFFNTDGIKNIAFDRIKSLCASKGIEYPETTKGLKLRLDRLIEAEGRKPDNQC
jgi:hypothetical protein